MCVVEHILQMRHPRHREGKKLVGGCTGTGKDGSLSHFSPPPGVVLTVYLEVCGLGAWEGLVISNAYISNCVRREKPQNCGQKATCCTGAGLRGFSLGKVITHLKNCMQASVRLSSGELFTFL